jgi:sterol desaturase/sphingolipid hydroxylase (fatty acid hydroxylase superfamily)
MKKIGGILAFGAFAALYFFEIRRPLRRSVEPRSINTLRNLAIAATAGIAASQIEKPVTDKLTKFVEKNRFGLLKIVRLPKFIETTLAVILLDYTLYLWHVLTHKVPFLWRFHQVHHADLDLTASTAIRFHFGEITISVLFRAGQVLLIGVSPKALEIWQTLLLLSILFHHSNVELSEYIEKTLQKLIVTPRLHGIHHSEKQTEMNSNWSSGLSVWDKIHKTFRDDIPQNQITIGVREFKNEDEISFNRMIAAPFQF